MQESSQSGSTFGQELRRRRDDRGLSLRKFSELVHYSPGYIGKVETGDKPATLELARRCDDVLEAGGELIRTMNSPGLPRFAQLPASAATFVGRQDALDRLAAALAASTSAGSPRVVAVDGSPGMGKTALALRLGHQAKDQFPDGQLFVNLRGHSRERGPAQPAVVLEEFLVALGVQAGHVPDRLDQRAALYRSLVDGRRVLVVLDNASDFAQVEPLLPASPRCGVILTSRARVMGLEIPQDHRVTLRPMTEDEAYLLLRTVIGGDRVDSEAEAAQVLAARCGRMPLALRLAAERVALHPHRPIRSLVSELGDEQDRLDLLAAADEQQLRTVISWSYRDLDLDLARLFRYLGLHPGPHISTAAAAALIGSSLPATKRLLECLVSMHLIECAPDDRYQMHDLLRVYAAERCTTEDSEAERDLAGRRLVEWYLHAAYQANGVIAPQRPNPEIAEANFAHTLPGFADYESALAWCEQELPNFVAVARLALTLNEREAAWQLPVGLWNFLFLRKRWSAWIASHLTGLEAARQLGDPLAEAWTLNNLAVAYRELRRNTEARSNLDKALTMRRTIGDRVGEAWTLTAIGFLDTDEGRFDSAAVRFRQALELRAQIADSISGTEAIVGNLHGQSIAAANLGVALYEQGMVSEALAQLEEALDIAREIDDRHGESYVLVKLADAHHKQGQMDRALGASAEALRLRAEVGDRWGEAEVLHHQGHILRGAEDLDGAVSAWEQAEAIFDDLGDPRAGDVRADLTDLRR
jgi:tetratricopeptide (TPR) repeat protein/transcriptional regulator with XRE-family HTH domain